MKWNNKINEKNDLEKLSNGRFRWIYFPSIFHTAESGESDNY